MRLPRAFGTLVRPRTLFARHRGSKIGSTGAISKLSLAAALAAALSLAPAHAQVRVSALYGGGGASASGYVADYVELFNAGTQPQSLAGWTLQYQPAAATGAFASIVPLSGTINPGRYFLIRTTAISGTGIAPAAATDLTVAGPDMSATTGKLALVSNAAALVSECATASVVDFVGYGTSANCREPQLPGAAAAQNAPAPSATAQLRRQAAGLLDRNQNNIDFAPVACAAGLLRNSASLSAAVAQVDGSAEAGYATALSIQNTQTGYGDSSTGNVQTAPGSELDQVFGFICNSTLYVHLAGNLQSDGHRVVLLIDSIGGGQNTLRGDNALIARMGTNGGAAATGGPGMKLPGTMAADFWFAASINPDLSIDSGTLPTSAAGTGAFVGTTSAFGVIPGLLSGGTGGGIAATMNNANVAGVAAGNGSASGGGVTTGLELAIPLASIGNPTGAVRILAIIVTADYSAAANQSLAGCNQCGNATDSSFRDWSATAAAIVTVPTNMPVITAQPPMSPAQCNGLNTTIAVSATGSGLTYQWQQSVDGGATWLPAVGASTTTATMTTSTAAVAGTRYRALVGNACGHVASASAALTINSLPARPVGSIAYTAAVGTPVILSVTVGASEVAEWFSGATCTGTLIHTGTTYSFAPPAPGGTFAFSVRARNTTTNCVSSTCLLPVVTAVPANDQCVGAIALGLNAPVIGTTAGAAADYRIEAASPPYSGLAQVPSDAAFGRDVVYRFTPAIAARYSFRVTAYSAAQNPIIYVTNACPEPGEIPTAQVLSAANRTISSSASEEAFCVPLVAGAPCYIFVDDGAPALNAGASFTIEVTRCNPEIEPNDSPASATLYTLGDEGMQGSYAAGNPDFYALGTPVAGSRIFAMTDCIQGNTGDLELRLTNQIDTLEFDDDDGDAAFGASGFSPAICGGIADGAPLYLRVNHHTPASTQEPYRLYSVVQSAPATPEAEPNDTTAAANSAASDYFSGSLSSTSDADTFAFSAIAGQLLFIGFDGHANRTIGGVGIDGTLALLDSAGAILLSVNGSGAVVSSGSGTGSLTSTTPAFPGEALVFRVAASGTYYARVTTSSSTGLPGSYLLSISTYDAADYCSAGSAACAAPGNLSISRIVIGAIDNPSSDGSVAACYQDFTTNSTVVRRGVGYPIAVTAPNDLPGNACTVWVDFDNNRRFGDPGETFALVQGPIGTYTGTVLVPPGASLGPARMRIRVGDVANLPCGQTALGEVEDYTMVVEAAATAPANDTCASAQLVADNSVAQGATTDATIDTALPLCTGTAIPASDTVEPAPRGVWYAVIPSASGTLTAHTLADPATGSGFDTEIVAYSGECESLICIAANDNIDTAARSKIAFPATAGVRYLLLVGGNAAASGAFALTVRLDARPSNDACAAAATLPSSGGSLVGTTAGATIFDGIGATTASGLLDACPSPQGLFDVWYRYIPACTGPITIDSCGPFDTLLSVHSDCPTGSASNLLGASCNDDGGAGCSPGSRIEGFAAIAGTAYLIRVAGAVGAGEGGAFTLTWTSAVDVPLPPTGASSEPTRYCASAPPADIQLAVSGVSGAGTTVQWFTGSCGGVLVGTGSPLFIAAPAATTTYFARTGNSCGVSACVEVTVAVAAESVAPGGVLLSVASACSGDAQGIIVLTAAGGSGEILEWFSGACDGVLLGDGNDLSILTPATTTSYFARWRTSGCGPSACASATFTVRAAPVAPSSASADVAAFCAGSGTAPAMIELSAMGGSGDSLEWFSGACGGDRAPIGNTSPLVIPAPSATTVYFARWRSAECGASACASATVTVQPGPTAATGGPYTICADGVAGLAGGASGGSSSLWTTTGTGTFGNSAAPSTVYFPSAADIVAGGVDVALAVQGASPCTVAAVAATRITILPLPVAPSAASASDTDFCAGTVATIALTAAGGSGVKLAWFAGGCGPSGTSVGSGPTINIAAPSATTTYYATWLNPCGASACVPVTVTVTATANPVAPTSVVASADTVCSGSTATLTLTAIGGSGASVEWFDDSCGGHAIGAGVALDLPGPAATTTYFARWVNACGPSACAMTTVSVAQAVGACCSGWGTAKVCQVVAADACAPVATPAGAYRGDCTTCTPAACCRADYNNSGGVSVQDIFDFLFEFLNGTPPPSADFNNNGTLSPQDLFDFLSAYFTGC